MHVWDNIILNFSYSPYPHATMSKSQLENYNQRGNQLFICIYDVWSINTLNPYKQKKHTQFSVTNHQKGDVINDIFFNLKKVKKVDLNFSAYVNGIKQEKRRPGKYKARTYIYSLII